MTLSGTIVTSLYILLRGLLGGNGPLLTGNTSSGCPFTPGMVT